MRFVRKINNFLFERIDGWRVQLRSTELRISLRSQVETTARRRKVLHEVNKLYSCRSLSSLDLELSSTKR